MRYRIDWIPLSVVSACFGLSLMTLFVELPAPALIGIFLLIMFLRNPTLCAQHNHSHLSMFRNRGANFLYDLLLAQTTGYGTPEWELQHNRGHHSHYLNPDADIAGSVDPRTGETMSLGYYIWQGYWRIFPDARAIAERERDLGHPRMLRRLWTHAGIQLALTALWLAINPLMATLFFVVPNLLGRAMVWWGSYWHHLEVPRNEVYDGCRTEEHPIFNWISFNSGHHTAHHEKPALHWSLLPARTAAIRERIPAVCFQQNPETVPASLGQPSL